MDVKALRNRISSQHAAELWLCVLCCSQPFLDVFSTWIQRWTGSSTPALILRGLLLAVTLCFCLLLTQRRRAYLALGAVLCGFWLCHVLCALRVGYRNPVSDAVNFARVAQTPLLFLCVLTLLYRCRDALGLLARLMVANLYLIAALTLLALVTGTNIPTYEGHSIGVTGWFNLSNSQSAILAVLTTAALFSALQKGDALRCALHAATGFALLFFLGTRLAYAAIFGIAALFFASMLICRCWSWKCFAAVALCATLCLGFYRLSPMTRNRDYLLENISAQQQLSDGLSAEQDSLDAVYRYVQPGLVKEFGLERVQKAYNYTRDFSVLGDERQKKLTFCRLTSEDLPKMNRVFGFELDRTLAGGETYDVENDFHGIYYLYGWVGLGLFAAFLLGVLAPVVRAVLRRRVKLSLPLLACAGCLGILLINAYCSSSVLRRPNGSVYLSCTLAALWVLTFPEARSGGRKELP